MFLDGREAVKKAGKTRTYEGKIRASVKAGNKINIGDMVMSTFTRWRGIVVEKWIESSGACIIKIKSGTGNNSEDGPATMFVKVKDE